MEQLLSVNQAAELLGTTVRFPRRLVAERRVRFIHVGRHVRIPLNFLQHDRLPLAHEAATGSRAVVNRTLTSQPRIVNCRIKNRI